MRGIISTLILVLQGLLLGNMNYSALNWEYWGILLLTVAYMLSYQLLDD